MNDEILALEREIKALRRQIAAVRRAGAEAALPRVRFLRGVLLGLGIGAVAVAAVHLFVAIIAGAGMPRG